MSGVCVSSVLRARRLCAEHGPDDDACFRVVSRVVPESLRPDFVPIFSFARTVSAFAADGDSQAALDELEDQLRCCFFGETEHPLFAALTESIEHRNLPMQPFVELIEGHRDHLSRSRFATYADLRSHTDRAVGSVARLVLYFLGNTDSRVHRYANELAGALAEVSFWRQIARDAARGRFYVPADDMYHFGVTDRDLATGDNPESRGALTRFLIARTRGSFERASLLPLYVGAELADELRRVWLEGMAELLALETRRGDIPTRRRTRTSDPFGSLAPWADTGGAA